jgi:protein-tyrosine phosphatase
VIDIHCHCLPGLDDGPSNLDESIALCIALVNDGVQAVAATPHQLGRYDLSNTPEVVRSKVSELSRALAKRQISLEIAVGGDIRIDERLPQLMEEGRVCTVRDLGRHILLELPTNLYCEPKFLVQQMALCDVQCIVTHPERHRYLQGDTGLVRSWIQAGAAIQVTAASLLGEFGRYAYGYSWNLVRQGLVSIIASDSHDIIQRPPRLTSAREMVADILGADLAELLCVHNPRLVWEGYHIEPVPN